MSILSRIKSAFGISKPLALRDGEAPARFTDDAVAFLRTLPPDRGVHFSLLEIELGYSVRAEEGESQGPAPEGLGDLPVTMSDPDFELLKGLTLDRRDGRWAVGLELDVRARETPNPDGRVYLFDRILAVERALVFAGPGPHPDLPTRLLAIPGVRSVLLRDNTCTIERTDARTWEELDRDVDAGVRAHFLSCGHEVWPAHVEHPPEDDEFKAQVWQVLQDTVLPGIHRDGGNLELLSVAGGVARVSMEGSCRSCPSSTVTLKMGVERVLKERFPGRIHLVESV